MINHLSFGQGIDTVNFRDVLLHTLFFLCCLFVPVEGVSDLRIQSALEHIAPESPIEVAIGLQIEQIVNINQKDENYEVVGNLTLQWDDPKLSFDAREHSQPFKLFTRQEFTSFVDEANIFVPSFFIHNQQGRRFTQNPGVILFDDGHANYGERFTVKLQAPEFDFVQYPFDTQKFAVHVQALFPNRLMSFVPLEGYSRLGSTLGEEEWIFKSSSTTVTNVTGRTGMPTSRFTFSFEAHRHLNYYLLRIFLPLAVIILVSWLTFFLQDFSKRIDVAGANLLIFVAFNFTISSDLPRLGYMTFMDAIVVATFVFSAFVVIINVIFRRMESTGKENSARRMDNYTIWIYPFMLLVLVLLCWYLFLIEKAHI